ncbi:aminomethyltransferase family protein [Pseudomonas sp. CC6-YY-74]|uniref:glycine cleavage T C-terminal barrel domain-containing protein n=1 Tax=Pseudomonas sp. CC6-YY-74 TaxID=1930532 RepID=UPI0009A24933|nr:aminomethyltransferase family protein [Pseudomonas sp. CC6-YY-74]
MGNSIHSDTENTVQVGARRFEKSPYYDFYANSSTVLGVVAGRYYGVFNGEDPIDTYWTLRRKAVLYDVPEKPWQIEGPDAVPFMERVFARRIENFKEGRGLYAIACTHDGGTFMDGILFKMGENRFWYVQPDGALEPWLMALSDGFDVKISDPKSRVLQIQGPNSMKIMSDLTGGAVNDDMRYFQSGFYDIKGQELYVSRTGWTGELGYEIYSEGGKTDHKKLWDDVMTAGVPHGMVYGSMASMEIRRIEAGILDNVTDFDTSMTPFEAGLGAFVDVDKEGFVGRDALQNADRQVALYGVKCQADTPEYRGEVLDGSSAVGHVTAAAWSPYLNCGIGYVRFKKSGDWAGKKLSMKNQNGETVECEIVELPFYDKEKRIPRGQDKTIP